MDYWTKLAKDMESMGADSICLKDMSGILTPQAAAEIIPVLKKAVKIPVQLHSHCTSGVALMSYMKAIEAGCDIVDTAISPWSMGTSQPATEVICKAFEGTEFDPGLDQNLLAEIADYFRPLQEKYIKEGRIDPKVMGVNIKTLLYQVPGGMLSNLVSQLKDQNASDKFYDVLQEVPNVRNDLGQPPLVTPSSQIVGTQAVLNVLMGERYKIISKETKAILKGEYGKTILPFNEEVQKKALGDEEPITCRPADLLKPELEDLREKVKAYSIQEEDVLSYALFPEVATEFFRKRDARLHGLDPDLLDKENKAYPV